MPEVRPFERLRRIGDLLEHDGRPVGGVESGGEAVGPLEPRAASMSWSTSRLPASSGVWMTSFTIVGPETKSARPDQGDLRLAHFFSSAARAVRFPPPPP